MLLLKCCTQYASKFGKHSSGQKDWKMSVFIPIPKKGNAKECSNYCTIALISHASKVMLKTNPGFNNMWTMNFQMFKMVLEKAKASKIKLPTSVGSLKKQEFQKNIYFCFIEYVKPFNCVITTNCGKFFKRWEHQTTWLASWEICMQVRKQQLELDMEKQTGSK